MQVGVDTKQENITVKERYYFFVADRRNQKNDHATRYSRCQATAKI